MNKKRSTLKIQYILLTIITIIAIIELGYPGLLLEERYRNVFAIGNIFGSI